MRIFSPPKLIVTHPARIVLSAFFPGLLPCFPFALGGLLGIPYFIFQIFRVDSFAELKTPVFGVVVSATCLTICGLYLVAILEELYTLLVLKLRGEKSVGKVLSIRKYRSGGTGANPIYRLEVKIEHQGMIHTATTVTNWLQRWLEASLQEGATVNLLLDPKNPDRMRVLY